MINGKRMTNIVFMHQGEHSPVREVVCKKLAIAVALVIELPLEIQIRFADLGKSVYGHTSLDLRFKNRISINTILQLDEIPTVLVHELIHLSQSHTGMLMVTPSGQHFWKNKLVDMSAEYDTLPWEKDVQERHDKVMTRSLQLAILTG